MKGWGEALARRPLKIAVQLLKHPAQTVELIDEVENDVDTFVIDSEVGFQIPDENVPARRPCRRSLRRRRFALE
jgi:hypothetical protein